MPLANDLYRYVDPDATKLQALIQISCLFSQIGRDRDAQAIDGEIQDIFQAVPYDPKTRSKHLGGVHYHPGGTVSYDRPKNMGCANSFQTTCAPYSISKDPAATRKKNHIRKTLDAMKSMPYLNMDLGWPGYVQLRSAVSGTAVPCRRKGFASAMDIMITSLELLRTGDPDPDIFKTVWQTVCCASESCEASPRQIDEANRLARRCTGIRPDEGVSDRNGWWVVWYDEDDVRTAAQRILNAKYDTDLIYRIVCSLSEKRRAVFIPETSARKAGQAAYEITEKAVGTAITAGQLPGVHEDYDRPANYMEYDVESAIVRAGSAATHFNAYRILDLAARRDPAAQDLFRRCNLIRDRLEFDHDQMQAWLRTILVNQFYASSCGSSAVPGSKNTNGEEDTFANILTPIIQKLLGQWYDETGHDAPCFQFRDPAFCNMPESEKNAASRA